MILQVYGLSGNSALIVKHNREGLIAPFASTNVLGACLLTWGDQDKHLKIRLKKNCAPEPLLSLCSDDVTDHVTTVNICNDATYVWIGYASGKIVALRHTFKHRELSIDLHTDQSDGLVTLYGHNDAVNDIAPCIEFGLAVSASSDATSVIWDLRKPSYVRSVRIGLPAKLVAVSKTSGDFAVISESAQNASGNFSTLSLFTVNGTLVISFFLSCQPQISHSFSLM